MSEKNNDFYKYQCRNNSFPLNPEVFGMPIKQVNEESYLAVGYVSEEYKEPNIK